MIDEAAGQTLAARPGHVDVSGHPRPKPTAAIVLVVLLLVTGPLAYLPDAALATVVSLTSSS